MIKVILSFLGIVFADLLYVDDYGSPYLDISPSFPQDYPYEYLDCEMM